MLPEIAAWPASAVGALFAFGGLAALSQGMVRHHAQVWTAPLTERRRLLWRSAGGVLLFAAYFACLLGWGIGAGLAAWFGLLSLAGLALVFLLPYAGRSVRVLAVAAPALGLAALLGALVAA